MIVIDLSLGCETRPKINVTWTFPESCFFPYGRDFFELVEQGMLKKILFKNALIVTLNAKEDLIHGDLLVCGEEISAIGVVPPEESEGAQVIDCEGNPIIPGFVQTHIHLCQTLMRNMADDMVLIDWLKQRIWPYEAALDPERLKISSHIGLAELILGGTTAIVDMGTVHHTESIVEAVQRSGIDAVLGKCMMDLGDEVPAPMREKTADSLKESRRLFDVIDGLGEGRLRYGFAPRFAISCTETLLREVSEMAKDIDAFIHTHGSETAFENDFAQSNYGCSNIEFLEKVGMTGEKTIIAHGVHLADNDIDILAKGRTIICHCPSSNLKLASGIANIPLLDSKGVRVSLGADGAPCNNNLDAFIEMRLAALLQKPIHGPTAMPAKRVLKLATIDGAHAIQKGDVLGSLEVGKLASLVVLDLKNDPGAGPGGDIYSRIVYGTHRANVQHVFARGKHLVDNKELVGVDLGQLMAQGREALTKSVETMQKFIS